MSFRCLAALAAVALLAPSASAQLAPLDARGVYVLAGNGAPERLLFPRHADPHLVVGARLGPGVDVQVGVGSRSDTWTALDRLEVGAFQNREKTEAAVAALGVAGRLGPAALRASLSLGYDRYAFEQTRFRPDSVDLSPYREGEPVYALAPGERVEASGRFGHVGTSLTAGLPLGRGRVRVTPTVGLAGALSAEIRSELPAQAPRLAAFVRLPATVRVRGIAITAEAMIGGMTTIGRDGGALSAQRATDGGALIAGSALRIDL